MHLTAQVPRVELYITTLSDCPCFIFQHHTNVAVETNEHVALAWVVFSVELLLHS